MPTKAQTIVNAAQDPEITKEQLLLLDGYPVKEDGTFDFDAIDASYEAGGDGTVVSTKEVDATTTPAGEVNATTEEEDKKGYVQDPKTHMWTLDGERVTTELVPKAILEEQDLINSALNPELMKRVDDIALSDEQNDKITNEVSEMTRYYNNVISANDGVFKSFAQVQRETEGMKRHAKGIKFFGMNKKKVQNITDAFSDAAEFVSGTDFGTYDDHIAQARRNIVKKLKAEGTTKIYDNSLKALVDGGDEKGKWSFDISTNEIIKEAEKLMTGELRRDQLSGNITKTKGIKWWGSNGGLTEEDEKIHAMALAAYEKESKEVARQYETAVSSTKEAEAVYSEIGNLENDKAFVEASNKVTSAKKDYEDDMILITEAQKRYDADPSLENFELNQQAIATIPLVKEKYALYEQAFNNYETTRINLKNKGEKLYQSYKDYRDIAIYSQNALEDSIKTQEDLAFYADVYGKDDSILWGQSHGKLTTTVGDMAVGILEFSDMFTPGSLAIAAYDQALEWGYEPGDGETLMYNGIVDLGERLHDDFKMIDANDRHRMRAFLGQYRNGLSQTQEWSNSFGSLGDFGSKVADMAFNQAPNLALMYYTGGASLYIMGAVSAGGKFGEYKDYETDGIMVDGKRVKVKFSPLQMYSAAMITGIAEGASEKITLGQIGGLKAIFRGQGGIQKGFANYLTKELFSIKGMGNTLINAAQEGGSEAVAQLCENYSDNLIMGLDVDPLQGVGEAWWSGVAMSTLMFKSPAIAKNLYNALEGKDANQKIAEKQQRVNELSKLLNNKDLSDELSQKYQAEHLKVITEINKVQQGEISKLDEMSDNEKKDLLDIHRKKYELRELKDEIVNSEVLTPEQKQIELNKIDGEISSLDVKKNEVIAPYYLEETINEITIQADAIGEATGKTSKVTAMAAEEVSESLLEKEASIREEIDYYSGFLGTEQDAVAKQNIEFLENQLEEYGQADKAFGYINNLQDKDGNDAGFEVIINKSKPMVGTAAHELMHAVLFKTLQQDQSLQDTMGDALLDHVATLGGNSSIIGKRLEAYGKWDKDKDGKDVFVRAPNFGEEAITVISEAIYDGTLEYKETFFNKIGNVVRRTLQDKFNRPVKFNTGRDVYNFIKDFNKSLKDKKINKSIIRTAAEGAKGKLVRSVKTGKAASQYSKDAFENSEVASDLGLTKNTVKIVAKNNDIEKAILKEGVKDGDGNIIASTAMQQELVKNNLPRAFALARQAAGKANDLTLEEALKMNDVMEWYSEYSLKLNELAVTYKAKMADGTKVPFGAYMNNILPKKYSGILDKLKGKVQASSMSEEATAKEVGRMATPTSTLSNMEVEGKVVALNSIDQNKVQKKLVNIAKEDPSLGKLRKYKEVKSELTAHNKPKKKSNRKPTGKLYEALETISGDIFGVDAARIIQEKDLTTEQRKSAQDVILKYTNEIIAMMPFGTTASGDATGVANTKLGIFYKKLARTKMKATGTGKGLATQQKQNIDPTKFRALVGLVKGGRINNTSVDGTIRAVIVQVASIASNQAIRQVYPRDTLQLKDGKGSTMFSADLSGKRGKDASEWPPGSISDVSTPLIPIQKLEKLTEEDIKTGFRDTDAVFDSYYNTTFGQEGVRVLNDFIKLHPQFRQLFQTTMTGGMRGGFFLTKAEFDKVINETDQNQAFKDLISYRIGYNKGENLTNKGVDIFNDPDFKKDQSKRMDILYDFFKAVESYSKDNKNDFWFFEELAKDTGKGQSAFSRVLAPYTFYPIDKKGKPNQKAIVVEEHSRPQNTMVKAGLLAAFDGRVDAEFKVIKASFMQGSFLKIDDDIIGRAKLGESMPDIFYSDIAPRLESGELVLPNGLAAVARLAAPGTKYAPVNTNETVDLNNYYLPSEGKTIAEYFGVEGMEVSRANELIIDQLTGEVTLEYAKAMNKVSLKTQIKESKTLSDAILFSRTVNPTKGMSAWDLDDTLARTKSGVKYTMPNPDMSPQPGRKVIFMAGGPGSGKSTVIKGLDLKNQGFKIVNQDTSLEWLMKNHGLPTDMKDFTPEQASKFGSLGWDARMIAKRKQAKFQGKGDGIVVDGTGNSLKEMQKQVQEFKNKGYDIQMVFVETSLETALERNRARKERSLRDGIVKRTHESVQNNKEAFKELFGDNFAEVKTDNLKQEDPMPSKIVGKMDGFTKGYIKGRLSAEEFANEGTDILEQGGEFDFAEFDYIKEGEQGPLFNKAMESAKKFGLKDQFILTARPHAAKTAIYRFLDAQGLNIPFDNIITLEDSSPEAKALWIADKVGEGYNDIYFADDALQNVQAVKNMLDQFDVKSKVQQAKRQSLYGNVKTKSKKESIKSELGDVNNLDSPNNYNNIQFSKAHRSEYENTIAKYRPDLVKDKLVSKTIDNMFIFIDSLNIPDNKRRKYERITTKWLATSNVKLVEDRFKITDAINLAERYKEDIFSYRNPNEIIEKYAGKAKKKPLNPNKVKEFSSSGDYPARGVTSYDVENTKEGQQAVRDIIDSHWGENSNPWCITQAKNGKLTDDAWLNWTAYEKGPKRIIFQDGKLSSFYANYQHWDRMDNATDAPVIQVKKGRTTSKVELVPVGDGKIQEFVRETRTVSVDKKTVTTEIFEDSQDGWDAGTKIVENRINGITVKSTRYDVDGNVKEIINFDKAGKAIEVRSFEDGKTISINNDTKLNVEKHGDIISHEVREGKTDYWFGEISMEAQGIKDAKSDHQLGGRNIFPIGFQTKVGFEVMDIMERVSGKLRVDTQKLLEIDPDAKGLPKTGIMFSKSMNNEFNDILEQTTKIDSKKVFSDTQARLRGNKGKYKGIIPASAQDFAGLLYNFLGKGKIGEKQMAFFKKALIDPFARGINELNASRQSSANDYKNLLKEFPKVKKRLNKKIGRDNFTVDQAIRVYLWNKAGFEVPGISKRDLKALVDAIKNDSELQAFADALGLISKKTEGYSQPGEYWLVENIGSDLLSDGAIGDARSEFLAEWQQNIDQIFSKENLNKIEAIYGSKFREALEDILYRMKTGRNRPTGSSRLMNMYMNWVNNSVGAIMFFNIRSAVLQTISLTNYLNWTDNNPLKAAAVFANQKQYWKDFAYIFNSDYLKQRRSGNQRGINEAELSAAVAGAENKVKAALAWLLKKGFLPTQIADSFAIASGGATFYRNRVNKYLKEGMAQKEAEAQAWLDFQETTEVSQQSARPDMISQQQASPLGRLILAFQNTPMQYARIMNKAARDLVNGRGDSKTHISKIAYYGVAQAIIFGALQSALFAALGDEDEEEFDKKKERILNQMIDSWLSGIGVGGKAISTIKNTILEYLEQKDKKWNADHGYTILSLLGFSPPIGSKVRKIYSAIKTDQWNEDVFKKRGFTLDNPIWSVVGNVIEGVTNIPLGRISQKLLNIDNAMESSNEWWQRVALVLGWNTWDLGVKDPDIEAIKTDIKEEKKGKKKDKDKEKEKVKEEKQEKILEKGFLEDQKKEIKEGKKDVKCSAANKRGERCKTTKEPGSTHCTIHIKVVQRKDGKKVQCKKIKSNKKQCGTMTANKSGLCYYHD